MCRQTGRFSNKLCTSTSCNLDKTDSVVNILRLLQNITPIPSHIPQCKALYQFKMNNDEEEGCLIFNKGDIINVIRRVDENWAEGKLDGKIGIFPLAFVEMNSLARSLMKLSSKYVVTIVYLT